MAGDRTETASQHRRDKARKEGDILHSREMTAAAGTLAGVMTLGATGHSTLEAWRTAYATYLNLGMPARWEPDQVMQTMMALRDTALGVLMPSVYVMFAVAAAALAIAILQTGGISLHMQSIGFNPGRLNPINNLQGLFSLRAVARLGKSLVPAAILGVFAVQRIARQLTIPPFSTERLEILGGDLYGLLLAAAWLLFGWSAIDFLVEWQSREKRLKMSKQDQRDEYKETEGNPQIRSRIRSLQRAARRKKVKNDVSKAAVVITNPTHYAVALSFDFAAMEAPKVVAKGRNLLAQEIKAEARWSGIPIVENPPLARSLYRLVEVGGSIPTDLYQAVAAILAYLYRQRVESEMRDRRAREAAAQAAAREWVRAQGGKPSPNVPPAQGGK